jgi:hypothetical protein
MHWWRVYCPQSMFLSSFHRLHSLPCFASSITFLSHPTEGRPQEEEDHHEEEDRRQEEISTRFIYDIRTREVDCMVKAWVMYVPRPWRVSYLSPRFDLSNHRTISGLFCGVPKSLVSIEGNKYRILPLK